MSMMSWKILVTEVAAAAPWNPYQLMSTAFTGTLTAAVMVLMMAGGHTMFCTCRPCTRSTTRCWNALDKAGALAATQALHTGHGSRHSRASGWAGLCLGLDKLPPSGRDAANNACARLLTPGSTREQGSIACKHILSKVNLDVLQRCPGLGCRALLVEAVSASHQLDSRIAETSLPWN